MGDDLTLGRVRTHISESRCGAPRFEEGYEVRKWVTRLGGVLWVGLMLVGMAGVGWAAPVKVRVCVTDKDGLPVAGAAVRVQAGPVSGLAELTDGTGCTALVADGAVIRTILAMRAGFEMASTAWTGQGQVRLVLQVGGAQQQVEVTAARVPLALEANASSVRTMSAKELGEAPGLTLDDRLREVAGFQLFRRTSSQVANPTTEGTSLRGLGSTAASRTLVLSDQVPLNDAYGGWIHWDEIPELAVRSVELVRGGASDLYGSSAIGGVIDALPVVPAERTLAADLAGSTEDTFSLNGLGTERVGEYGMLGAVSIYHSDGYILTAPAVRGLVDVASTVRSQSGRVEGRRVVGSDGSVFLRGNLLNEVRGNGTPVTTNATRIWRYVAGGDLPSNPLGKFFVRAYGDDQGYRQSFSSIATDRNSEQLTRLQRTRPEQVGGSAQGAWAAHAFTFVAGADGLDTRARDDETPVSKGVASAVTTITARQRGVGGYGEVLWQPVGTSGWTRGWSTALSGRVDSFRDFDAHQYGGTGAGPLPEIDETVFDPRLGVVKQIGGHVSVTGSVFRAFRGPTMNELYRTGQVGQQTTEANASLRSERATGFEFGALLNSRHFGSLRTSYFWTQVNRPVAAVTLSSTGTTVLLQRQNLGQLESRGVTTEWVARPAAWVTLTGGYQFAYSTVTKFPADLTLVGKWTAQVPRDTATAQVRFERRRWGVLAADALVSGKQFDDSANAYELHGYPQFNAFAEHHVLERLYVYASVQNLLNRSIDAGRTPLLTLASPRVVTAGVRVRY